MDKFKIIIIIKNKDKKIPLAVFIFHALSNAISKSGTIHSVRLYPISNAAEIINPARIYSKGTLLKKSFINQVQNHHPSA